MKKEKIDLDRKKQTLRNPRNILQSQAFLHQFGRHQDLQRRRSVEVNPCTRESNRHIDLHNITELNGIKKDSTPGQNADEMVWKRAVEEQLSVRDVCKECVVLSRSLHLKNVANDYPVLT